MGYAIYQWLIMRQGIATIKPDVHIRRFIESILNRPNIADKELVTTLEKVAIELGLKAYELDWRISQGKSLILVSEATAVAR